MAYTTLIRPPAPFPLDRLGPTGHPHTVDAPSAGIALAVIAGIAWSVMDVLRKRLARNHAPVPLLFGLVGSQLPIFGAWAMFDPAPVDWAAYAPVGLATWAVNLGANLAFLRALQIGALSRTVPILAITPVLTTAAGALLLGEWPNPTELIGIAMVVLGSGLLAFNSGPGRMRVEPGSFLMLGVAVGWALTTAFDKMALQHSSVPSHALIQSTALLAALAVHAVARGPRAHAAPFSAPALWLSAAVMAGASSAQYFAIERTMVSLVETIKRAVGTAVALIVGRTMFGERIDLRTVVAALLLIFGTGLVLLDAK